MKIVVLVKHVPDATGKRGFVADGTPDRAAADGLLSELDEYAVKQALQLAEEGDGVDPVGVGLAAAWSTSWPPASTSDSGSDPRGEVSLHG